MPFKMNLAFNNIFLCSLSSVIHTIKILMLWWQLLLKPLLKNAQPIISPVAIQMPCWTKPHLAHPLSKNTCRAPRKVPECTVVTMGAMLRNPGLEVTILGLPACSSTKIFLKLVKQESWYFMLFFNVKLTLLEFLYNICHVWLAVHWWW